MRKIVVCVLLLLLVTGCTVSETNSDVSDKKVKYIVEVEFPVGTVKEYKAVDYFAGESTFRIILEDGTYLVVSKNRTVIRNLGSD